MAAANALRRFMEEDHITSYDPRWAKGLMRHLIVRTAAGTGEVMVILVINGKAIPNAPKLIRMLDDAISAIPVYETAALAGMEFNLESVVVNINSSKTLKFHRSRFIRSIARKCCGCMIRSSNTRRFKEMKRYWIYIAASARSGCSRQRR